MWGRKLADSLGPGHPLGLVANNYGGTTIGAWLNTQRFLACNASSQPHGEPPNIHGNNPTVIYNTFFPPYTGPNGQFQIKVSVAAMQHTHTAPRARCYAGPAPRA